MEFQDDATLVSCSVDGSTKFWDISTGTPKTEVPGEKFTFSEAAAGTEQRVGRFLVTSKGDMVLVHHADGGAREHRRELELRLLLLLKPLAPLLQLRRTHRLGVLLPLDEGHRPAVAAGLAAQRDALATAHLCRRSKKKVGRGVRYR